MAAAAADSAASAASAAAVERPTPNIMISYCAKDCGPCGDGSASLLAAFLRGHGHRVFVYDKAQRAVDGGDGWRGAIQAGLLGCSVFVAMCSSGYAASESAWTTREFFLADEKKKYIVPLHHSGVYPPPKLAIMLTGVPYFPKVYVIPLVMPG